jgi:hypothetical protein
MKVADVKLSWVASVSTDVVKNILSVAIDGNEPTLSELSPEVTSAVIEVNAQSSVVFSVTTVDSEGLQSVSSVYTFTLGDLEAPQPVTNLFHEIVAVRDADVPVDPPVI